MQNIPSQNYKMRWEIVLIGGAIHLLTVLGFFYFSWSGLLVALLLCWITCGLGITLGYHRLLTHRSYKTYKVIEWLLSIIGCSAWQNGPMEWVGTHRMHHASTDLPGDPHSPIPIPAATSSWCRVKAFVWGHMGWMWFHLSYDPNEVTKDLQRDPVMVLINRLAWAPGLVLLPFLYLAGERYHQGLGMSWMVWGGIVRAAFMHHATWLVNSASHVWGYRNFDTPDQSRNLWWVALLCFGEGWHNNHHAQHRSAAHGMMWWEFDLTYSVIKLMELVGLAWDVIEPEKQRSQNKGVSKYKLMNGASADLNSSEA